MVNLKLTLIMTSALILNGCTSINSFLYEGKCTSNNWSGIGQSDALQSGKSKYSSWVSRCTEYNVTPNESEYKRGFREKLGEYCYKQGTKQANSDKEITLPTQCSGETELSRSFYHGKKVGADQYCTQEKAVAQAMSGRKPHRLCRASSQYKISYGHSRNNYCSRENFIKLAKLPKLPVLDNCTPTEKTLFQSYKKLNSQFSNLTNEVAKLRKETTDLRVKIATPSTPKETIVHYQEILKEKERMLMQKEKELAKIQ